MPDEMDPEDDESTCGKGLAAHSPLPRKLGELMASVAEILERHTNALDLSDERSRLEHDAYLELVASHRRIASDLISTAERMAGYRDLPMGRHDLEALAGPGSVEAFSTFVRLEGELIDLLERRIREDREMLPGMMASDGE